MKTFILVVYLFSNNVFYGKDAVPTLEFKTEQDCKTFVSKIKSAKEVKTEYLCVEK